MWTTPPEAPLVYAPPSGLEAFHSGEAIRAFQCRRNVLPEKVLLKDYNYRRPSLEITGTATVDQDGEGTVYFYHEHFRTGEEGNRLATIRAEGIICKGEEYLGESSVPSLVPGYTFTLADHYRKGFNQKYLIAEVVHEGDQTSLLPVAATAESHKGNAFYGNTFVAIPAATQFRPQVVTVKPTVSGIVAARVDAAGSGQYAELDDMGRYKVIIPFDLSGRRDGKASAWVRMAQSYAGSGFGTHYPLHKGTEVLLTFVNGDPDRPVIVGAAPNPATQSPVTSGNQTQNVTKTKGGNEITLEDRDGGQHLLLKSPVSNTTLRLGATQTDPDTTQTDPAPPSTSTGPLGGEWTKTMQKSPNGVLIATNDWFTIQAGFYNSAILGDQNQFVGGLQVALVVGEKHQSALGGLTDVSIAARLGVTVGTVGNLTIGPVFGATMGNVHNACFGKIHNYGAGPAVNLSLKEFNQTVYRKEISAVATRVAESIKQMAVSVTNCVERELDTNIEYSATHARSSNVSGSSSEVSGSRVEDHGAHVRNAGTAVSKSGVESNEGGTRVTRYGNVTGSAAMRSEYNGLLMLG